MVATINSVTRVKAKTFGDLALLEVDHVDLLVCAEFLRNRNKKQDKKAAYPVGIQRNPAT